MMRILNKSTSDTDDNLEVDLEKGEGDKITKQGDRLDFDEINQSCSPKKGKKGRYKRNMVDRHSKVHTVSDLVGGDWVYCKASNARMTISFFFTRGNKTYGMTCAHIAGPLPPRGLSLFVNDADDRNALWGRCKGLKEIGKIVTSCLQTDTCVFSVNDGINVKLNTVRLAPGHLHEFDPHHSESVDAGDILTTMFGAQGRGMMGEVLCYYTGPKVAQNKPDTSIMPGDVIMEAVHTDDCQFPHTYNGDYGGVSFTQNGFPVSIHRLIEIAPAPTWLEEHTEQFVARITGRHLFLKTRTYKSYSTSLDLAMRYHVMFLDNMEKFEAVPRGEGGCDGDTKVGAGQSLTPFKFWRRGRPSRVTIDGKQYLSGGAKDPSFVSRVLFGADFE